MDTRRLLQCGFVLLLLGGLPAAAAAAAAEDELAGSPAVKWFLVADCCLKPFECFFYELLERVASPRWHPRPGVILRILSSCSSMECCL